MKNKKESDFNFESALSDLESIVKTMEQGELSLDKSLAAFEDGIKLTKQCQQALQSAEQRVLLIQEDGAEIIKRPFRENQDD